MKAPAPQTRKVSWAQEPDSPRRAQTSEAGKAKAKEVRYVHALLEKTKERKREDERLFEKRLVAELKAPAPPPLTDPPHPQRARPCHVPPATVHRAPCAAAWCG